MKSNLFTVYLLTSFLICIYSSPVDSETNHHTKQNTVKIKSNNTEFSYIPSDVEYRLRDAADRSDLYSMYLLGSLYYFGEGWQKDIELSKNYLTEYLSKTSPSEENRELVNLAKEMLSGSTKQTIKINSKKSSPNNNKEAILYESSTVVEECYENCILYPLKYLEISNGHEKLIIHSHWIFLDPMDWINDFMFYDDTWLLLSLGSITATGLTLINTDTFEVYNKLRGGRPHIIKSGSYEGLIIVTGIKSYHLEGGAYWYSLLYDIEGNVIGEELTGGSSCDEHEVPVTVAEIIDVNEHDLKNMADDVICVSHYTYKDGKRDEFETGWYVNRQKSSDLVENLSSQTLIDKRTETTTSEPCSESSSEPVLLKTGHGKQTISFDPVIKSTKLKLLKDYTISRKVNDEVIEIHVSSDHLKPEPIIIELFFGINTFCVNEVVVDKIFYDSETLIISAPGCADKLVQIKGGKSEVPKDIHLDCDL